jgi:hypothetical protein
MIKFIKEYILTMQVFLFMFAMTATFILGVWVGASYK